MNRRTVICGGFLAAALWAAAVAPGEVRWSDESSDTTRITTILMSHSPGESPGKLIAGLAREFEGTPYEGATLECMPESLSVSLRGMDCTTFVENVVALALTVKERRSSWIDFVYNLERLRYRGGRLNGYASRMHYLSDWIVDNSAKGLIADVTDRVGANVSKANKTLNYMSSHRNKYPALADSAVFERLKDVEVGFRRHLIRYIKSRNIDQADIRPGDIIAITTVEEGLDVSHVGFASVDGDGTVRLLHASSREGKVVVDPLPLKAWLKRNRKATGIKVIRLKD